MIFIMSGFPMSVPHFGSCSYRYYFWKALSFIFWGVCLVICLYYYYFSYSPTFVFIGVHYHAPCVSFDCGLLHS